MVISIVLYATIACTLYGTKLVGDMRISGWICWLISDCGFLAYNIYIGEVEQSILWGLYLCMAVRGLVKWIRASKVRRKEEFDAIHHRV